MVVVTVVTVLKVGYKFGKYSMLCLIINNTISDVSAEPFEVVGCVKTDDGSIAIGEESSDNVWREVPEGRAIIGWVFKSAAGQFCDPDELKNIEELRAEKLAEIEAAANKAHDDATAGYSEYELKSFNEQEAAAQRGASDSLIITLAAQRGKNAEEMVVTILNKANALRARYGEIIGKQRVLHDTALAATDKQTLLDLIVEI